MIIYRYLTREILFNMMTVAGIVLVIAMGWRFSGYLREAASGILTRDILFLIMYYRLPGFLELILPLSFFLGIMLAYGRLYVDSEMVVLEACGMSPRRLIRITMSIGFVVMLFTACTSLWLKPVGEQKLEQLFTGQRGLTEFDTLAPGRFQTLSSGKRVTYTEQLDNEGDLAGVFINEIGDVRLKNPQNNITIVAASGSQVVDDETGNRFLLLKDGARYTGVPGQMGYQIIDYEAYGQLIARERASDRKRRRTALDTKELWKDRNAENLSELQWRVSIVLLVPVLGLLAIPLSRVDPRQGRFSRIAPGLGLSFLYVFLLSISRSAIEKGQLPPIIGLWWVHGFFLVIAIILLLRSPSKSPSKWGKA